MHGFLFPEGLRWRMKSWALAPIRPGCEFGFMGWVTSGKVLNRSEFPIEPK